LGLFATRTSWHVYASNQLRVLLAALPETSGLENEFPQTENDGQADKEDDDDDPHENLHGFILSGYWCDDSETSDFKRPDSFSAVYRQTTSLRRLQAQILVDVGRLRQQKRRMISVGQRRQQACGAASYLDQQTETQLGRSKRCDGFG